MLQKNNCIRDSLIFASSACGGVEEVFLRKKQTVPVVSTSGFLKAQK